ncbi:MAG: putative formaldehyde dehydrogenase AdhA [Chlamydiales bacterium]|nr:putative formaldehyde dehydrogenase AdhA [Chlamydiales bacterium]MCH9635896.1 putative formaldehyde dehydrogenase AdhA [Chlamydiales bacterium]MCH9703877.1 NAD(P)-dependent alcohol dehydrogenase [Chlamydiota bacterium]
MPKIATKTRGFAAMKQGAELQEFEFDLPQMRPFDVMIEITHCGICHSDIHLIDNDWNNANYPLVPGHEIVGRVIEAGPMALHAVGARVGVGWLSDACRSCNFCLQGEDIYCSQQKATCVDGFGGFAEKIVVDSRSAFMIPDQLSSENAAPLLCGGATVWGPLTTYEANAIKKIAVVGVGGLGHLAVQFAKAFGAEVFALSSSKNKRESVLQMGADHFIMPDEWKSIEGCCDLVISSVSEGTDIDKQISLLGPEGVLCLVGAPQDQIQTQVMTLLINRRKIAGSYIGSMREIPQMLEVAARHEVVAKTELFALEDVNEAIAKVRENRVRYRAVLKIGRG